MEIRYSLNHFGNCHFFNGKNSTLFTPNQPLKTESVIFYLFGEEVTDIPKKKLMGILPNLCSDASEYMHHASIVIYFQDSIFFN